MKCVPFLRWAFAATLALGLVVANAAPVTAQQRGTVRGTVRDAGSQQPVAGVQVVIPNTQFSTVSDAQGRYEITGVPAGGIQVRVRAPGYSSALATSMVPGGQAVTVDFALNGSVIALDEVVVTGTGGTAQRKQLGNTIATVKADQVADAPVANLSEALAAREAGVSILPSSGLAGEGARIRIRGNASLSQSNEPVVYIDGVRIDNGGGFGDIISAGGAGTPSRLDDINPEQIERIEILKGAAAATLYGSEASAGVIQVFTKKGTQGRPKFSFRVDQGMSRYPAGRIKPQAGYPRTQAKADTLQGLFRGFATTEDGGPITPYKVFWAPLATQYYATGYAPTYSGNVSGGGTDATYNVSARYTSELGPFHPTQALGPGATSYDRKVQTSANVTMFPKDRISIATGLMYADTRHITPQNGNNIYAVQSGIFDSKPENAQCSESLKLGLGGKYGEDPNRPGHCAGPGNEWGQLAFGTPREFAQEVVQQDGQHFNGNIHMTYEPVAQKLKFDGTAGIDITDSRNSDFLPFGYNYDNLTQNLTAGYKGFDALNNRVITMDLKGNWNEKSGRISSQLTLGTQGFITKKHDRFGEGWDFPGPGLKIASAGANQDVYENFSQTVNIGMLGQEQIGFNDWAFITGGLRWDRNSAFGEKTSGALYPKVSASLVLSDMPGWSSSLVSTFRLRGAFGKSGLQPGAFDKFTTFGPGNSQLGSGLLPANLGNPNLRPEVTREFEAGSEIAFFNNKLGVDVTYWDRKTTDALVLKQYPPSGGFVNQQLSNIGVLASHGWDLKLNTTLIDRKSFGLDLFANGAFLYQKIVSMGGAAPIKVGGSYPRYRNWLKEGFAPGALFGVQILQPCGQTQFPICLSGNIQPGTTNSDTYPYDTNGDGKPDTKAELLAYLAVPRSLNLFNVPKGPRAIGPLIDDNNNNGDFEDHYLGKPTPDWQGAFGANIRLGRNWSVNSLFEYKAGHFQIQNLTDGFRHSSPSIGRNTIDAAKMQRDLENPASTPEQRLQALVDWAYKFKELNPYNGLHLVEDGDFVRFREVGITYTAPASLAQRLGLSNLAFNATGRNVLLFTKYKGIDPEMNAISRVSGGGTDNNYLDSVDAWGFPLPRRFTFSVRFGF